MFLSKRENQIWPLYIQGQSQQTCPFMFHGWVVMLLRHKHTGCLKRNASTEIDDFHRSSLDKVSSVVFYCKLKYQFVLNPKNDYLS